MRLLILLIILVSCSTTKQASRKLKRANRLIERAKQIDPTVSLIDTVIVSHTAYIEAVRYDTIFNDVGDTVTIENEKIKVIYKRDTLTNTIFIDAECKADTITVQVPCLQEILIQRQSFFDLIGLDRTWKIVLFWLSILILVLVFLSIKII